MLEGGGPVLGARVLASGLLVADASIHLDLYLTGYRTIPTIGWLFLLQVATGMALGLALLATGSLLAAAGGALFSIATLGGYLLSLWVGLFGFKEVRTTAGMAAGVIDVAAFAVLSLLVVSGLRTREQPVAAAGPSLRPTRLVDGAVGGAAVLAAIVLGASLATAAAPGPSRGGGRVLLEAREIAGAKVLTDAKGFTLYWFARDTATRSSCYGSCAAYWPPVIGTPVTQGVLAGSLGTIRRSNGSRQATYDRHPLYRYIGDSAPGQAHGNGVRLNGGLWHEVTVAG